MPSCFCPTAAAAPTRSATWIGVFGDARFRRELLDACGNEHVQRFWRNIASRPGARRRLENIAPYIVSKLTQFVGNPVISPIVCARESTIDFNRILDSGGVCLVNLAKGLVGHHEAEILGGMFTTALLSAALARAGRARERAARCASTSTSSRATRAK
jgi:hypothetical protein